MKRGFTLVELSIVLVIIGLLIGGILVARSMMDTARVMMQIKQLQQFDIATQNFITRYGNLPNGSGPYGGASNDGWLHFNNGEEGCVDESGGCYYFFYNLYQGGVFDEPRGYLNQAYPMNGDGVTPQFGKGAPYPISAMNKNTGVAVAQSVLQDIFWKFVYNSASVVAYGDTNFSGFTPSQALALDSKIDDGNGYSGKVAVMSTYNYPSSCATSLFFCGNANAADPNQYAITFDTSGNCVDSSTGAYVNLSSSSPVCYIQVKANINR